MFDLEQILARRLKDHGGASVEDGVTDADARKERFREIITRAGLADTVIGKHPTRGAERYREFFKRCYGEEL